jgi:hypothetical protein
LQQMLQDPIKKLGVPYKQYLMSGIPPNQGS